MTVSGSNQNPFNFLGPLTHFCSHLKLCSKQPMQTMKWMILKTKWPNLRTTPYPKKISRKPSLTHFPPFPISRYSSGSPSQSQSWPWVYWFAGTADLDADSGNEINNNRKRTNCPTPSRKSRDWTSTIRSCDAKRTSRLHPITLKSVSVTNCLLCVSVCKVCHSFRKPHKGGEWYCINVSLVRSCSVSINSCKSESVKLSPEATLKVTNCQNSCTCWARAYIKDQLK